MMNPAAPGIDGASLSPPPALVRALQNEGPVLVLTHERPDGDAVGSVMGAVLCFEDAAVPVAGFVQQPVARRYRTLDARVAELEVPPAPAFLDPVVILVLDASVWERVHLPPGFAPPESASVVQVDHHPDNTRFGDVAWVVPGAASTAGLVFRAFRAAGFDVSPDAASWFLAGLVMDTGGFRFSNTTAGAFRTAAELLDAGAAHARVMDCLFFREPRERRLLEGEILRNARFAFHHRFAYAILEPGRMQALGLQRADTEGVIDVLRSFDGPEIVALLEPVKDGVHVSLRSRNPEAPVDDIARELGGGGHRLAAGATVRNHTIDDVIQRLLALTGKVLDT